MSRKQTFPALPHLSKDLKQQKSNQQMLQELQRQIAEDKKGRKKDRQQHEQRILKEMGYQDTIKQMYGQIWFYFIVSWMIQFILAAKDSFICLNLFVPHVAFTFKTWLWVDGSFTIIMWFFFFLSLVIRNHGLFSLYCTMGIVMTCLVFKIIWIFLGIGIFLTLNFDDCSSNLVQFMSIYFIYVFYNVIYVILSSIVLITKPKEDQQSET